jgi:hypothetical protein
MAGHDDLLRERAAMPVDYNGGEHPYRVKQEFSPNHRHVPFSFLLHEEIKRRVVCFLVLLKNLLQL